MVDFLLNISIHFFVGQADRAGRISKYQLKLACKNGDPSIIVRCKLYYSISLIQRGKFQAAKNLILSQYEIAKKERLAGDDRVYKMCHGIWLKLQYSHSQMLKNKKRIPRTPKWNQNTFIVHIYFWITPNTTNKRYCDLNMAKLKQKKKKLCKLWNKRVSNFHFPLFYFEFTVAITMYACVCYSCSCCCFCCCFCSHVYRIHLKIEFKMFIALSVFCYSFCILLNDDLIYIYNCPILNVHWKLSFFLYSWI